MAKAAIEARDIVRARLLPGHSFLDMDGVVYRQGQVMRIPRRHAKELASSGLVEMLD